MYKKILIILLMSIYLNAVEFDAWGHTGITAQWNLDKQTKDSYAGVSASVGFDVLFDSGITFGLGGWVAYPIYEQMQTSLKKPYRQIGVISDAYFAYNDSMFQVALGRYDTNNIKYEWFSGHNEGISASVKALDFMRIWGLYSYEQAFSFRKINRETYGQMNALWNYKRHNSNIDNHRNEHLVALGIDFSIENIFRITPYTYLVTNNFISTGFNSDLFFGNINSLYSNTSFKYTFLDELAGKNLDGHLIWIDQEFGYDWFKLGGGYYKTYANGVQRLTYYGDKSRFYGSVIAPSEYNASGKYFDKNQSSWYVFINARHEKFKIDLLYAGGSYNEISALASIILFEHLEFGGGYVNLSTKDSPREHYITTFIKAIW